MIFLKTAVEDKVEKVCLNDFNCSSVDTSMCEKGIAFSYFYKIVIFHIFNRFSDIHSSKKFFKPHKKILN